MDHLLVLFDVGLFANLNTGLWVFVDAFQKNQPQMQTNQSKDCPRQDEHMKSKESRQCIAANDWPSQKQIHDLRANKRDPARNGCTDADSPVRIGVEAHDLTGKGQAKREEQQDHAGNPG